jgi:hypothetical protein
LGAAKYESGTVDRLRRAMQVDRELPLRYISKQEGVRHILHAAIRSVFYGEDPFAIHLLGQSADKVLGDLLKNAKIEDPVLSLLKLELRSEFFKFYRESYNFLKHADQDSGDKLGVHNITASNDILIYLCILRYGMLFGSYTYHMRVFWLFVGQFYPGTADLDQFSDTKNLIEMISPLTRGDLLTQMWSHFQRNPTLREELQEDLQDVARANASQRKSP